MDTTGGQHPMESAAPDGKPAAKPCKTHGQPKRDGDSWKCPACGAKLCGAKLRKKPGKRCRSDKLMPSARCRIHGGKSLSGPASPTWKHGRRSNHRWLASLPGGNVALGKRFNAALDDPTLQNLRASMALNDALITSYTASLKVNGKALTHRQQKRIHELLDMQRKLAADEARRQKDMGVMVSQAIFAAFTNAVLAAVVEHVPDVAVRLQIQRKVQAALLTSGPGAEEPAEGGNDADR